jgi:hypothetical protein
MKVSTAIKCRNLFILIATFCVLCLSPLADVHIENSSEQKNYVYERKHNETYFPLLLHELLFTYLQHTFDHITLGVSHQTLKKSKNHVSKETTFSSITQTVLASNSQNLAVYSSTAIKLFYKNKQIAGIYSQELSGLSPPNIPS